nr:hypothetical protein [Ectothiorhodospira sp. BSL-9]
MSIHRMNMKNRLCDIDADPCNVHLDFSSHWLVTPHPHQFAPSTILRQGEQESIPLLTQ